MVFKASSNHREESGYYYLLRLELPLTKLHHFNIFLGMECYVSTLALEGM